jgi:diguanylate cyclase (GGDEF)-like protein
MDGDRPGDFPDGVQRDESSVQRDESSLDRDESAVQRDASSTMRDRVADDLDDEAARLDASDDLADRHTLGVAELRGRSRSGRARAADNRTRARHDREHAREDRDHAEHDRTESRGDRLHALDDREHSSIDELTGARRRGVGLEDLRNEIRRAHRGHDQLVVAYVDVDRLKSVNDAQGHTAGDELLRAVAIAFRREMRPYDLLVRLGGDEFLGVLPNVGLDAARERFDRVQSELALSGNAISIGYAELRGDDSAEDMVGRADAALLATRGSRRQE